MIVPTCCQNLVKIGPVVIEISRGQKRYGPTDVRTYTPQTYSGLSLKPVLTVQNLFTFVTLSFLYTDNCV